MKLAGMIEGLALGRGRDRQQSMRFSALSSIVLVRVGKGVAIKATDDLEGATALASMTEGMATDLVRQIRAAASQAEATD